jgi:2-C-methyl-D-erythritol 4-phosphate cytidylyltransferase
MNYGILLAAGMGTRLNGGILPKQFLNIGGTSILRLTVEKFLLCQNIERIVIAVPAGWEEHASALLSEVRPQVSICQGGRTRQESLYKALKYIEETIGVSDDDIAISHDVARPFVSMSIIEENIRLCRQFGATDTVYPATDTIVVSQDGTFLSDVPNRKYMYQGQTPQSFYINTYISHYEASSEDELAAATDAARLLMHHGVPVAMVSGTASNIKITTEQDLSYAEYLLRTEA